MSDAILAKISAEFDEARAEMKAAEQALLEAEVRLKKAKTVYDSRKLRLAYATREARDRDAIAKATGGEEK